MEKKNIYISMKRQIVEDDIRRVTFCSFTVS